MRFFVARVNLDGAVEARLHLSAPLQMAYESPKFMLPIRLGTVNADGQQELFVYALTRKGRDRDDELSDREAAVGRWICRSI